MSQTNRKIVQYLEEAHGAESAQVRVLQAQIAVTPAGQFRNLLSKHLGETRRHAERLHKRIDELDGGAFKPLSLGIGMAETVIAQALAIGKTPFDLLRRSGGEEKVLEFALEDCGAEAREVATYVAIERLAVAAGDDQTAKLCASIRDEEEHTLARLRAEIPRLAEAVAGAAFHDDGSYEIARTGAADAVRSAARTVKGTVADGIDETRRTARQARRIPGVAAAAGEVKGALATAGDLPIAGYDSLTSAEIASRLSSLSQVDLGQIDAYERLHAGRATVLDRVAALRGNEPWPGYDEQTVDEIDKVLAADTDDEARLEAVRTYERSHKDRATVIRATDRALAPR